MTRSAQIHPDDRGRVIAAFRDTVASGRPFDVEYRRRRKDGSWVWLRNRSIASSGVDGEIEGLLSDVTDKRQLEETVRQAQKMEAIGQLTGGIAHDFNNILAVVQAYSQFLIDDLGEHDPRRADAEEIAAVAGRAASLTRQLLAFSRRQVLEPTSVDLNAAVSNIERMLRRSIGEDIHLSVVAGADLGTVHVDVGQIEQVLLNLAVNARDAMPTGGQLSIETANVDLDQHYADGHRPVAPGRYVVLAVSDTGCGMDAETQRRIFEPFFTTKELGKGTGLGLSTVYGIVKQSGGYIWVYSEVGKGTVFKVYLPRIDAAPTAPRRPSRRARLEGDETILLIEDDARVRTAVSRMLENCGYTVLLGGGGAPAHQDRPIDLVLSDVVMPGASGPEVVAPLLARHPTIKVLYMSGYTDHAILRSGALAEGVAFIQKPFSPDTLAKKVREVLDA